MDITKNAIRKVSLDSNFRKHSVGSKTASSNSDRQFNAVDPKFELHRTLTKSSIRKPSYLPPILEEKCPSLTNLQDIIEENYKTVKSTTSRRRSLSENAVEYLKAPEKRGRWKRWNPINKLWHQLRGTAGSTNQKNKQLVISSISDSNQSVPTSCNCIN